MKRLPVRELYTDTIHSEPVDMNWSHPGYEEESEPVWTTYESVDCQECGALVLCKGIVYEEQHRHIDEESECMGHVYAEGPMMNYYYPVDSRLRFGVEDSCEAISHLPLCIVELKDTWALALAGGGMDLSWEICEAFMRLGYLPPLHYCSLPAMAGKRLTPTNRWILAGCRRSCSVMAWRAKQRAANLRNLRERLKQP